MSYKTIFSYFFILFLSFVCFILVFSNIFIKIHFSSYNYFYRFFFVYKPCLSLQNKKLLLFNSYNRYYSLFLLSFLAKVYFLVLFFYNYSRAKRQVQRWAKSASVSETTLRVRCNVCSASIKKNKLITRLS